MDWKQPMPRVNHHLIGWEDTVSRRGLFHLMRLWNVESLSSKSFHYFNLKLEFEHDGGIYHFWCIILILPYMYMIIPNMLHVYYVGEFWASIGFLLWTLDLAPLCSLALGPISAHSSCLLQLSEKGTVCSLISCEWLGVILSIINHPIVTYSFYFMLWSFILLLLFF